MAIEEQAFSIKKRGKRKKGELIYYVTKDMVKAKWSEIVSVCSAPVGKMKAVSERSVYYTQLRNHYPNAQVKSKNGVNHILVTPREASYIYWVVAGEMKESVFQAIIGGWQQSFVSMYEEAYSENALSEYCDNYINNIDGLRTGLGKDARKDADILDTWMWGSGDKKGSFITQVNGFSKKNNKKCKIKYNRLAMSGDSKKEVFDDTFIFEPRRNKQVRSDLLRWE